MEDYITPDGETVVDALRAEQDLWDEIDERRYKPIKFHTRDELVENKLEIKDNFQNLLKGPKSEETFCEDRS
ncbi:MAG: hypothetical protein PF638_11140 [Candidatus Delongbacteria bacterium]|nr:hypothetical protein [Candidatus Delongbacteria bacterium]